MGCNVTQDALTNRNLFIIYFLYCSYGFMNPPNCTSIDTVNSQFKKDFKLQIHLHKAFFLDDRFLNSLLHKSFLNQTTLDLRKEKWSFLNREFTVLATLR